MRGACAAILEEAATPRRPGRVVKAVADLLALAADPQTQHEYRQAVLEQLAPALAAAAPEGDPVQPLQAICHALGAGRLQRAPDGVLEFHEPRNVSAPVADFIRDLCEATLLAQEARHLDGFLKPTQPK